MTPLPVIVDSVLRLDPRQVDENSLRMIWSALTVVNPDDPSQVVGLGWEDEQGRACIPRGFALRLKYGLAGRGYEVQWVDNRTTSPAASLPDGPPEWFETRGYQQRMVERMVVAEQMLVSAPTGAGKSAVAGLHVIRSRQRACVIVDKVNIATQWIEEMHGLGINATFVGDNVWDDTGDIVVTLRQTLWARRQDLLDDDWFSQFGELHVDEIHGVSSSTTREIINCFPAKNRFGHSATLERREWMTDVSRVMIGEVGVRVSSAELAAEGVLVQPRVLVVKTDFQFEWDRKLSSAKQWHRFIAKLRDDPDRNRLIGRLLSKMRGRCVLVQTDQLGHADEIAAQALANGWPMDSVMMLTSKADRERRSEIMARAEEGDCVIVTTIGKEALNARRLDVYMLAWPAKLQSQVLQMVGRVRRTHSEKSAPVVVDLYDPCGPGPNQFQSRRGVYESERLSITFYQSDVNFVI